MTASLPDLRAVPDDPKDDPIIATAVASKADYLVTGDWAHLLPIGQYKSIRIVNPREFLITSVEHDHRPRHNSRANTIIYRIKNLLSLSIFRGAPIINPELARHPLQEIDYPQQPRAAAQAHQL
jgi:hypothetical protein